MKSGQVLVMLLVFAVVAITITTAATAILMTSTQSASHLEIGTIAYLVAESGAENALIQLLRNPAYGGETLTLPDGVATITVADGVVTSTGQSGNFERTIQVTTTRINSILRITNWTEIWP